jgi:hypothetical protein
MRPPDETRKWITGDHSLYGDTGNRPVINHDHLNLIQNGLRRERVETAPQGLRSVARWDDDGDPGSCDLAALGGPPRTATQLARRGRRQRR